MGDTENALPPSKKRAAGIQISKENPGLDDEEDVPEQETGTFKRASDEVMASRRIVRVRRNPTSSTASSNPSTASSNPFAGIRLVPPSGPTAAPDITSEVVGTSEKALEEGKNDPSVETEEGKDESREHSESKTNDKSVAETATGKEDNADDKENNGIANEATESKVDDEKQAVDNKEETEKPAEVDKGENGKPAEDDKAENEKADVVNETESGKDNSSENVHESSEGGPWSSFQQLSSSQNAFTGLAGTGFSSSTFTFGSVPKDGSPSGASAGPLFGHKSDQPSFGFGLSTNGSSSLFSSPGSSLISKNEGSGFLAKQDVQVETGEENERVAFSADSVLFEFHDGAWKERGKGEVKVNVSTTETDGARLIMRAKGNYRLILNARLYSDMKLTNMEKRGITFACANSITEGKDGLSTYALKFKDSSVVEDFRAAVDEHKGKKLTVMKTPENSPKALDEC